MVDITIEKFGRLDILILNAGTIAYAYFEDMKDMSILRKLMDVNYFGQVYPTKYVKRTNFKIIQSNLI